MDNTSYAQEAPTTSDPKLELLMSLRQRCYTDFAINNSRVMEEPVVENGSWCPRIFDGFACWDETPAGATAVRDCPPFVIGFDPKRLAYKTCTENGTWGTNSEGTRAWTNYTSCIDLEDLQFRKVVNGIFVVGYSISVAALLLSIMIFLFFRSLQCTRVRIHIQLFASISLNGIVWIIWYYSVLSDVLVLQENPLWCQTLSVVSHYFMVSSYMWMFSEGLHLHIALVVVFMKDEMTLRWFAALGWGLPVLIVGAYTIVRAHLPDDTDQCWMNYSDALWIIIVPVVLSLTASLVFLVNVVWVLVTKLHPGISSHTVVAARKAVRAALILVPLFGLHFVLIPLRPPADSPFEGAYQIFAALITSLQGLCVAVLFCFTNTEVVTAAQTHIVRYRRSTDAVAIIGVTAGESLANTRELV